MKQSKKTSHTTGLEIKFINGLGTHSEMHFDLKKLLENYLLSAHKRVDWGAIDSRECIKYARKKLNKLITEAA